MTKIIFEGLILSDEQMEAERQRLSKLDGTDLQCFPDKFAGRILFLSDDELKIKEIRQKKSIVEDPEIIEAMYHVQKGMKDQFNGFLIGVLE